MTARFHGTMQGSNKTASVRGSTRSGLMVLLMPAHSGLKVSLWTKDGRDHYKVELYMPIPGETLYRPKVLVEGTFPEKGAN